MPPERSSARRTTKDQSALRSIAGNEIRRKAASKEKGHEEKAIHTAGRTEGGAWEEQNHGEEEDEDSMYEDFDEEDEAGMGDDGMLFIRMFVEGIVEEAFTSATKAWQEKNRKMDESLKHSEQEMGLLMAKFRTTTKEVEDLRQEIKTMKETPPPPPPPLTTNASAQEVKALEKKVENMEREIEILKETLLQSTTPSPSIPPPSQSARTHSRTTMPGRHMGNAPGSYAQVAARIAIPASSSATSLRSAFEKPVRVATKGHSFSKVYAATERRILFQRNPQVQYLEYKHEGDLMLALNEALQRSGVEPQIRFGRIG
ncbi:MAG: hypothetical protein MMC33_010110, partial [Icmadophila ericetorum]|nr:hypothetical protein [Icmadophila ericetorum]